jgi:hypothetical protein
MWISINGHRATEISDKVINHLLLLYPEEKLPSRPILAKAFQLNQIDFEDLKEESEKLLIPWQMFLLDEKNLKKHITHIESQRKHKISSKLLAKRKGVGDVTSKRIIDRLIRQQNFLNENKNLPMNGFPGLLIGLDQKDAAKKILEYFEIDQDKYWSYKGSTKALEYFIKKIQSKNINICRGVLTHKLLPHYLVVDSNIYKNTSGFTIQDEKVPFIFLPNEVSNEADSRQLYTLIYLLVVIGLNEYSYIMSKSFTYKKAKTTKKEQPLHNITCQLLIPESEITEHCDSPFTVEIRDLISKKLKISPSALVTTLRIRGVITEPEYNNLMPDPYIAENARVGMKRTPYVSTAIRKFCGGVCYEAIQSGIQSNHLAATQAQYLIYGGINKKGFREFKAEINL